MTNITGQQVTNPVAALHNLSPVRELQQRLQSELHGGWNFDRPTRYSRAPGRLDVMGGIADYTGSLVCESTLFRAAAVALQERDDRQISITSFNLLDENRAFGFHMSLDALAEVAAETLRKEFATGGRKWAGYLAGCLFVLDEAGYIDLSDPAVKGLNIAVYSTVPLGAGVSSSAAIEVATMINLVDHFGLREKIPPFRVAEMCQAVENRIVGAPCGIMDQVTSLFGQEGTLLRMECQPHTMHRPLTLPQGIRVIGINSNVKHNVGGGMYGRARCAAFMAHAIILRKLQEEAQDAGRMMLTDPLRGYLANLDAAVYRRQYRDLLPEYMKGSEFITSYEKTIDSATTVESRQYYHVQKAADHHVIEAQRVREFVSFMEQAAPMEASRQREQLLRAAGQLMYGSHVSYSECALLGADECDRLVQMIRDQEHAGLYGAKITGGGSGGTVAVLCDISPQSDAAIGQIMKQYQQETGLVPEAMIGSSPGAGVVGTAIL